MTIGLTVHYTVPVSSLDFKRSNKIHPAVTQLQDEFYLNTVYIRKYNIICRVT